MRRVAGVGLLVGILVALGGCTGDSGSGTAGPDASSSATMSAIPSVTPGGARTAAAALRALCVAPTLQPGNVQPTGDTPPEIAQLESEVEQVRGLDYLHPVAVQAISDQEMDQKLEAAFDDAYPVEYYARRSAAWRTLGVLPPGADLRESLRAFLTGQVVGFYDQETGELVFRGEGDLGLTERLTLAHELTHALDDQHFELKRLDAMAAGCRDEDFAAALGLIEGSAQYYSTRALIRFPPSLGLGDIAGALSDALTSEQGLAGVPPFVQELALWPYTAGQTFVTQIAARGGDAAVDRAFEDLPRTTEQVIHPDAYPGDVPSKVDIPDLTGTLGPAWGDLDAMQVGEEWLRAMLALRLDDATADTAAAGWDGGVYRAWSDGTGVAVVLRTAWDSPEEAAAFAEAMTAWIDADAGAAAVLPPSGDRVSVVFATSDALVQTLTAGLVG